ncbi:MAG: MbcA/ParS/Xre antitoxin family protein [Candidatus Obscuribacterales bacterium]|nr:MbcA/ParS/Xre antitoxin family protein [Candidatus Obscuribacterales bacterium]
MSTVLDPKVIDKAMSLASPFIDGTGKFNVRALCEALTLTRKDLATATNKNPQWFQEYWNGSFKKPTDNTVHQTIEQLLLIYVLLASICKEEGQTKLWMRLPNPAFDNKTPASLIVGGQLDMVRDTLIGLVTGGSPA